MREKEKTKNKEETVIFDTQMKILIPIPYFQENNYAIIIPLREETIKQADTSDFQQGGSNRRKRYKRYGKRETAYRRNEEDKENTPPRTRVNSTDEDADNLPSFLSSPDTIGERKCHGHLCAFLK